ncbi:hypothetical protein [Planomicrobium sp. CPCC 101110]|uniref:hypothetical protein n=1 Tax=Planomicrobium sp. CPCC 101110 TaxID=2599619 RepID=UPI0011B61FAC|nr:hypothetical protein [Planomicrobium sp. CPCC 101110]TWT28249.1 hypothetical protein FQV30_07040 [Planomicrobium sp. CPCC 101110]
MAGEEERFVVYMPVIEEEEKGRFQVKKNELQKAFPLSLDKINDLVKGMTDYSLDTIELHITGVVKSGPITELFIGAEGEAGMKLVLNKKKTPDQ